ncbi:MAG: PrgI family protein [Patescibacteria group bacterium]
MQYQTPQFIEVEDKIFGPLTTKQFFYIAGGAGLIFLTYVFFQLWVVILLGIPVGAFALSLAFFKINGIPFPKVLSNFIGHTSAQKLYIWKQSPAPSTSDVERKKTSDVFPAGAAPRLTENKLQDLAWSLDVQQKIRK